MSRKYLKVHTTDRFIRKRIARPSLFEPGSFRTKKISGGKRLIVACPKGHVHDEHCDVGMQAQALLVPRKNPCVMNPENPKVPQALSEIWKVTELAPDGSVKKTKHVRDAWIEMGLSPSEQDDIAKSLGGDIVTPLSTKRTRSLGGQTFRYAEKGKRTNPWYTVVRPQLEVTGNVQNPIRCVKSNPYGYQYFDLDRPSLSMTGVYKTEREARLDLIQAIAIQFMQDGVGRKRALKKAATYLEGWGEPYAIDMTQSEWDKLKPPMNMDDRIKSVHDILNRWFEKKEPEDPSDFWKKNPFYVIDTYTDQIVTGIPHTTEKSAEAEIYKLSKTMPQADLDVGHTNEVGAERGDAIIGYPSGDLVKEKDLGDKGKFDKEGWSAPEDLGDIGEKKNPWYVVRRPTLEVSSGFPHFTEKSSIDEIQDMERHAQAQGRPAFFESLHTDHAVEPGDLIARDGRIVKRKTLGLENPFVKGKPKMWFPAKGSEAAKDLGSLLGKMRGVTGEEKEKLKALYRKTREKWMAREPKAKKNPYFITDLNGDAEDGIPHINEVVAAQEAARRGGREVRHSKKFFDVKPGDFVYNNPTQRSNSGVIDEHGQWEHCNNCGKWVLIQDLEYEPKSADYPYGRDLCKKCWLQRQNPLGEAIAAGIASGATMAALKNPIREKLPYTIAEAKRYIKSLGFTFKKDEAGDFVINTKGGDEDTAYYTDALDDAVGTAEAMHDQLFVRHSLHKKNDKNPYYVTDRDYNVVSKPHKTKGAAHESKASFDFFGKTMGRHHGGAKRYGSPFQVVHSPKLKKEGEYVFDNPHLVVIGNPPRNGVALPKSLERQILRAPEKDRPELLKGVEKYYEFHGCFPPKIVQRDDDHSKLGLPLVNVGLGWSDAVEYRSTNQASSKFFAGGKGKYVHKFGDELPKGERSKAKPMLVTDPTGKTLHYLPSRFKVKDWIHH